MMLVKICVLYYNVFSPYDKPIIMRREADNKNVVLYSTVTVCIFISEIPTTFSLALHDCYLSLSGVLWLMPPVFGLRKM